MQKISYALALAGLLAATMTAPMQAQTNKEGSSMPKVGDTAPDFTLKYFDGSDRERREVKRLPRKEERGAGVLHLRVYRWLNAANEKLPAEFESAGSSRHPGPGCEHG